MPQPLRIMSLHALAYCERLFYLEEVEESRVADAAVYAGRTLHEERSTPDPTVTEWRSYNLSSETLGIFGKVDTFRQRDGSCVPYEHKRGRPRRDGEGRPEAWLPRGPELVRGKLSGRTTSAAGPGPAA